MITPSASPLRLAWVDWMRGLACVLMFQTHCYDSWLGGDARKTTFFMWSQLVGTLPAPLFLFLAGVSFALVTDKLIRKDLSASEITRTTLRRGAEIFALGLLLRLQEYLIYLGWSKWTDILRVDILNMIGLSMVLMALVCGAVLHVAGSRSFRGAIFATAVLITTGISLLTPPLWTTWRPAWLPWPIESYVDGVHNLGIPQSWLFPIFPWTGFAFAGLAIGAILTSDWVREHAGETLVLFGVLGGLFFAASRWIDRLPFQLYAVDDYWRTSPSFFLLRVGMLMMIAFVSYAWCRWGLGTRGFSPFIQMGHTSLLVYWVHLEFVYGAFSILPKRTNTIAVASLGLLTIFLMMLGLSLLRTGVDWKAATNSLRTRFATKSPA